MQILFDVFKYTDEYWEKIQKGIVNEDDEIDWNADCILEKELINVDSVFAARPYYEGKFTKVNLGDGLWYVLNIPFNDYLMLVPHTSFKQAKARWAN